ncbi:hypothetical protein AXF42_Ash006525 [Apostasia shenzhenica]|uniref:Uncharacterized protein n=1 Tax=Apostasia shenzhenica TaxID=1088818 RepID=A0A2I0AZB5_9ASPA|nr:hypothetical protein AXF42_Ash006525 [Apostasia shenzhenica]
MSASDEKPPAGGQLRRIVPKLLASVLPLAMLLLWTIVALAVGGSSRPTALHVRDFVGSISVKSTVAGAVKLGGSGGGGGGRWISAYTVPNFTSTLLSRWLTPGGEPCRETLTAAVSIPAFDSSPASSPALLHAGELHELAFFALDESNRHRCLGGDYFEADLSGPQWKSRPPILDHGNGSYSLRLQIHSRFASPNSTFTLSIVLLFRRFDGLKLSTNRFAFRRELRRISIKFDPPSAAFPTLPNLQICRAGAGDFSGTAWSGRWTRLAGNDSCAVDRDGRYRCLPETVPCSPPWCGGGAPLAALESNGWVYSAHCAFRLFDQISAWRCLHGHWLLFWGDSNHVDTIRNLLTFVLGIADGDAIAAVTRRFDRRFVNPLNASESLRITNIFNGHWNETQNYLGLASLAHQPFRDLVRRYFDNPGGGAPDVVVLNSGLHDGVYWRSIRHFAQGAEFAAKFWEELLAGVRRWLPARAPRVFYRRTIAAGGYARELGFNPSKMEAFDGVFLEKLTARGAITGGVVDEFDMTFPWHYDNRCNDGVHYGRKPARARWRDGEIGHQYFVDLMLVHVLLNAFCNGW